MAEKTIDDLLNFFQQLDGKRESGPASEATLQLIAKKFKVDLSGAPTTTPEEKKLGASRKKEKKQIDDVTDKLAKWELELRKNNRTMFALYTGGRMFGEQLLEGQASLTGFSKALSAMADTSGSRNLFILAKSFEVLAKIIDKQIDNFKQLSEVGVQFSEGLFTSREAALRAQISLDAFSQAIGRSADTLALLGGSVRGGIERFTDISKLLQGDFRRQANGLGMTFEETTDLLTDYLEIQTSIGRAQTMNNRDLNTGAQDFIMNLDQLAAITGKQRKQIADELKADMMDKRIKAVIQSLESSMVPGVQEILGSLQGLPADSREAFKELIATGGVPLSDFGKSLVRLNPNIATFAKQVSQGNGSVEQFEAIIRQTAGISQSMGSGMQSLAGVQAAFGRQVLGANVELFNFTEFAKKRTAVERQQQKAIAELSNATLGFKDAFKDITNILMAFLAPAAEVLAQVLGTVAIVVNKVTGVIAEFDTGLAKLVGAVAGVVGVFYTLKAAAAGLRLVFSGLGKMLPSLSLGGSGAAVAGTKALGAAGPEWVKMLLKIYQDRE